MTSDDNVQYVTVEAFNATTEKMNQHLASIDGTLKEIRAEILVLDRKLEINAVKIEGLQYFMGIGFTIMAAVITLMGFVIALAPMFREMYRDSKREKEKSEPVRP